MQRYKKPDGSEVSVGVSDDSGLSSYALERCVDVASRLPYEESQHLLAGFGIEISSSELARLCQSYNEACEQLTKEKLSEQAFVALERAEDNIAKTWVLEIDGVRILQRPEQGNCEGMEIKDMVLYCLDKPKERYMFSSSMPAHEYIDYVSGLLRQAGVKQQDTVLGLADGAPWIADIFDTLGIAYVIDVFHAVAYLETIMQEMGWDDAKRIRHRHNWYRAKSYASYWLKHYLPKPDGIATWSEEAQRAYKYLKSRQEHMDYKHHKAQGYPIGSGQVESMNKAVIGKRMKQSGMQWSQHGAEAMAVQRSQLCAEHSIVSFEDVRQHAFVPNYLDRAA